MSLFLPFRNVTVTVVGWGSGSPSAAFEAKGVEDAKERVPDVSVKEGLVRQLAGAADFHCDVVVDRQGEQLRQFGERLRRRRWLVRLRQAKMIDHQPRIGIARCKLYRLVQACWWFLTDRGLTFSL
jgi:hypothetical protein